MSTLRTFDNGYALIIGTQYGFEIGQDSLTFTERDATGVHKILTDPSFGGYSVDNAKLLIGGNATRQNILYEFEEIRKKVARNPNSTVFIYYSGHGGQSNNNTYYLLPDGFVENQENQTGITSTELCQKINSIISRRLVVFMDCCHAGGMGINNVPQVGIAKGLGKSETQQLNDVYYNSLPDNLKNASGRFFIASSSENEYSYAPPNVVNPISIFTDHLIKALKGAGSPPNDDGYANIFEITKYLLEAVPIESLRFSQNQKPIQNPRILWCNNVTVDFPLSYYAGGNKTPAIQKDLPTITQDQKNNVSKEINSSDFVVSGFVYLNEEPHRDKKIVLYPEGDTTRTDIDGRFVVLNVQKAKTIGIEVGEKIKRVTINDEGIYDLPTPHQPPPNFWKILLRVLVVLAILVVVIFVCGFWFCGKSTTTRTVDNSSSNLRNENNQNVNISDENTNVSKSDVTSKQSTIYGCGTNQFGNQTTTTFELNLKILNGKPKEMVQIKPFEISPTIQIMNDKNTIGFECINQKNSFEIKSTDTGNEIIWINFPPMYKPAYYTISQLKEKNIEFRKFVKGISPSDPFTISKDFKEYADQTGDIDSVFYICAYLEGVYPSEKRFYTHLNSLNYDKEKQATLKKIVQRIFTHRFQYALSEEELTNHLELIKDKMIPLQIRKDAIRSLLILPRANRTNKTYSDLITYLEKNPITYYGMLAEFTLGDENQRKDWLNNITTDSAQLEDYLFALGSLEDNTVTFTEIINKLDLIIKESTNSETTKTAIKQLGIFAFNNKNTLAIDKLISILETTPELKTEINNAIPTEIITTIQKQKLDAVNKR